jgi:redox-sensitive bicupin YhaK (pirin superfamily)
MSELTRPVTRVFRGQETLEGAGVRLHRLFGNAHVPIFDPFLLLDNFSSTNPADYMAGFPWHPHRGIETVTYMLEGRVAHGDSLGNEGVIGSGDVQWMSAGSGIIHQEMPERREGLLSGFQLWVNLPASLKMENPAYRGLAASGIPSVALPDGGKVKVIAGSFQGVTGPVEGIPVDPTYLDVSLPPDSAFEVATPPAFTVFAYTVDGEGQYGPAADRAVGPDNAVLLGEGDRVRVRSGSQGHRFLLVTGRPLHEPVAWYGPIVMNRQEELSQALVELRRGDFVKHKKVIDEE